VLTGLTHLVLATTALIGCGFWWKRASPDRGVLAILAVGLIARAVPGLLLFWISEARLPLGRSLQLDPGFWFFAPDAVEYYRVAEGAAAKGLAAIATIGPPTPSVVYVKTLAAALYVFGASPATSLILNLLAFAALATVVLVWHRRTGLGRRPLLVALAGVSLAPSWILWSYQPLKDTCFLLLVGLFFLASDAWYSLLSADRWSWLKAAGLPAAQAVTVYGLAGIRWYSALVLVAMVPLGLLATLTHPRHRSLSRAILAACGLVLIVEVIVPGAGSDLPRWVGVALRPTSVQALLQLREAPVLAASSLSQTREGNLKAKGATLIRIVRDHVSAGQDASEAPWPARLRGNLAVMALPRALALPIGHVSIGGGRGLWAFVDLDTLFFEAMLVGCGWILVLEVRRDAVIRPAFWHVLAATVVITGLLAIEAANFGTLFRMRSMIAIGIALLPLTVERPGKGPASSHARQVFPRLGVDPNHVALVDE
jgi:hypothetical protein